MRIKTYIYLATIEAILLTTVIVWSRYNVDASAENDLFMPVEEEDEPIEIIDRLVDPVAVTTWSSEGLDLEDGRTVQLPGFRSLPSESPALDEAVERGVEIDADGRVWGLVRVHHWCGNDPVRKHIARIDISEMMTFLRVGEPMARVSKAKLLAGRSGSIFGSKGWSISEFMDFRSWQKAKGSAR